MLGILLTCLGVLAHVVQAKADHLRWETSAWTHVAAVTLPAPLFFVMPHLKHCDSHPSSSLLLCTRVTAKVTNTD